jgi:proline racemase
MLSAVDVYVGGDGSGRIWLLGENMSWRQRHEGILGTTFVGCLVDEARIGPYPAVVPTLSGSAWITIISQYVLDAEDPFPEGFTVGDLWASAC